MTATGAICAGLLAALALPATGARAECRQIAVAAEICAEAGLRFAGPAQHEAVIRDPEVVDMRLDTADHGAVSVTYFARSVDEDLGTLPGYKSAYLGQLESKGATLDRLYEFRHRGAPCAAQQFTAIHPGPGAGQFWGVAIGVEVTDGLVMVLIASDLQADTPIRADWTVAALDALHPKRPG